MAATKETKKHCSLKKKLLPAIKHSNLYGKNVFRNNYFGSQPFLLSCYFTMIFVNLSVIAAVRYFSIYKLVGWDPLNMYLFNVISKNARKRCRICPKLTINTVESCSGVLIVNFKHISHFFNCFCCCVWKGKCLSGTSFLGKYYYPRPKDE